jgi:hypothetical protein
VFVGDKDQPLGFQHVLLKQGGKPLLGSAVGPVLLDADGAGPLRLPSTPHATNKELLK